MLKFSDANAKIAALKNVKSLEFYLGLNKKVYSFDLLSGWSCPFADKCLSKVVDNNGKHTIKDGPNTEFRCFSASQEVAFPSAYKLRRHNFDTLKGLGLGDMVHLLKDSLPKNAGIVRIHVAGDFFNRDYMMAWYAVAMSNPQILFYAYTKSLRYMIDIQDKYGALSNFVFTASRGGRDDFLIDKHGLREAVVVFNEEEAYNKGLEIDHDDSSAADPTKRNQSFALLLHGVQPKGSEASKALKILKENNVRHSYSKKRKALV